MPAEKQKEKHLNSVIENESNQASKCIILQYRPLSPDNTIEELRFGSQFEPAPELRSPTKLGLNENLQGPLMGSHGNHIKKY